MKSKRTTSFLACFIAAAMLTALFPAAAIASPGDNLWISQTKWGQLIDGQGNAIVAKGDQMTIPVAITSAQGTILVTTPGTGTTDDELSIPQVSAETNTYQNVVYIDQVIAPSDGGSVHEYTFDLDPEKVVKGEKLYIKVGGTNTPAGDNQKASTVYLGTEMPGVIEDYSAVKAGEDLVITTPATVWTAPKVLLTVAEDQEVREITAGIAVNQTSITVPNSALKSAFRNAPSSTVTITGIKIIDSLIEDVELANQSIGFSFTFAPDAPAVTADDVANIIVNLDLTTMEYAISANDGATFGEYVSTPAPFLGGDKVVKVRVKKSGEIPAGTDTVLTFTTNYGDVSGDGVIGISDVIMTAEIAVGHDGYTSAQKIRANVSSKTDLTIDISDVVLIAERTVGGTAAFPVDQ